MSSPTRARWPWVVFLALVAGAFTVAAIGDLGPRTSAERGRAIAESIKCPTCQGQSVADSNATAARSIRTEIARRLEAGQTDEEIRSYIAGIYGDDQLLTPPRTGVAGLIWFLPAAGLVAATAALVIAFRRWRPTGPPEISDDDRRLVEGAQRARSPNGGHR